MHVKSRNPVLLVKTLLLQFAGFAKRTLQPGLGILVPSPGFFFRSDCWSLCLSHHWSVPGPHDFSGLDPKAVSCLRGCIIGDALKWQQRAYISVFLQSLPQSGAFSRDSASGSWQQKSPGPSVPAGNTKHVSLRPYLNSTYLYNDFWDRIWNPELPEW